MKRILLVGLVSGCNLIPGLSHPKSTTAQPAASDDRGGGGGGGGGAVSGGSPHAPSWCKGYTPSSSDSNASWVKSYVKEDGWGDKAAEYIAKASCDKPNDHERQEQLAGWIADYKTRFGGTDQDFVDLMTLEIQPYEQKQALEKEQCGDDHESHKGKDEASTVDRAERAVIGCGHNYDNEETLYWLDRPQITEVQRTAIVLGCLGSSVEREDKVHGEIAYCGNDMRSLDRAKFDAEIAAQKLNLYGRVSAVDNFNTAKRRATMVLAKYAALAKKDPDWKRIVEAGDAGYQKWLKDYEANKPSFEAVKKFDAKAAAGSKKALAGCGDELRKLFFAHMASKKIASADKAKALATDAVGYPLLVAMVRCDVAESHFLSAASAVGLFLKRSESHRGPRQEAYAATLVALNDVRNDREDFPLKQMFPEPSRTAYDVWNSAYGGTFNKVQWDKPAVGQIKSVTAKGDMVHLTFKTITWREEVADNCVDTRRVSRIREDGTLEYEQKCTYKMETMTSTEAPISVPKDFAKGLKPGLMIELDVDNGKGGRTGIPTAVYKDTAKKKLAGMFGVMW